MGGMNATATAINVLWSFTPFLNLHDKFVFGCAFLNFVKSFYVSAALINESIYRPVTGIVFTAFVAYYQIFNQSDSLILNLQWINLLAILYSAVYAGKDGIFLLALLSTVSYYLKPFRFIVDVFVMLFLLVDIVEATVQNEYYWSAGFFCSLAWFFKSLNYKTEEWSWVIFVTDVVLMYVFFAVAGTSADGTRLLPLYFVLSILLISGAYINSENITGWNTLVLDADSIQSIYGY